MSRTNTLAGAFLGGLLQLAPAQSVFADGGTVRASVQQGGLRVTVFTAPASPRVGPVDVSLLVQNAATGEPVPGVQVHVRATSNSGRVIARMATKADATNQLLVAAVLDVPEPGRWQFRVSVEGRGEPVVVAFDLDVGEALPGWVSWLGWLAWPIVVILVFVTHQLLVCRKRVADRRAESD